MPELPEVEVLVRHLAPQLKGKRIRSIQINRPKVIEPTSEDEMIRALRGAKFSDISRRGKYLLFTLIVPDRRTPLLVVGHLGMTGRIYLLPKAVRLPKHAAVVMDLGRQNLVYEDTRYFGKLTLDPSRPARLGPEPLGPKFTVEYLASALKCSSQPIKTKLLDQAVVAGVGNIYASEALFRASISPQLSAKSLKTEQIKRLWRAIRMVLARAIKNGSTFPLDFAGQGVQDGLFYYGVGVNASEFYQERLLVYDRQGQPCVKCGAAIKRIVQGARSTYFCPRCQRS